MSGAKARRAVRKWTPEEDEELKKLVEQYGAERVRGDALPRAGAGEEGFPAGRGS